MEASRRRGNRTGLTGKHRLVSFGIGSYRTPSKVWRQGKFAKLLQIGRTIEGNQAFAVRLDGHNFAAYSADANFSADPHFSARFHEAFPHCFLGVFPFSNCFEEEQLDLPIVAEYPSWNDARVVEYDQVSRAEIAREFAKRTMLDALFRAMQHQHARLIPALGRITRN